MKVKGYVSVFLDNKQETNSVIDYVPALIDWATGNFDVEDPIKFEESLKKFSNSLSLNPQEINQKFFFRLFKEENYPFEKFKTLSFDSVNNWMNLAFNDYLSARTLLLNHQELTAVQFCTSSVEKLFKYFIYNSNPAIQVNCQHKVHKMYLEQNQCFDPSIFAGIPNVVEFLSFLQEAYTLRYHDGNRSQYNFFVISKKWLLFHLDTLFFNFYTKLKNEAKNDKNIDFIFNKNVLIKTNNHILEAKPLSILWSTLDDMITEMRINGQNYQTITYTTDEDVFSLSSVMSQNYTYVSALSHKKLFSPTSNGIGIFDKN